MAGIEKQVRFAASRALNATAKGVIQDVYTEMKQRFDRPTPYIFRSMISEKRDWATKERLSATVRLRQDAPSKGQTWHKSLAHEFQGGSRDWRRFEGAFFGKDLIPPGMAIAIPRKSNWAIRLDANGNMSRMQIAQLISYFQAFPEQGHRANMNAETKDKLAKRRRTKSGYKTIGGVVYFIATRQKHPQLAPGIWAKRGIHGVDVVPVLLFVRRPNYRGLIDLQGIADATVQREFTSQFNQALASALATAR